MRWTPLIVRNMMLGCRTFGEIREGLPGVSKTLLSQRLSLLEHYGILERRPNPERRGSLYELTQAGKELSAVTQALGAWGSRWLELAPAHFDTGVLLWGLCQTVPVEDLPTARSVIHFHLRDGKHRRYWLLLDWPRAEVCAQPAGLRRGRGGRHHGGVAGPVVRGRDHARECDTQGRDGGSGIPAARAHARIVGRSGPN